MEGDNFITSYINAIKSYINAVDYDNIKNVPIGNGETYEERIKTFETINNTKIIIFKLQNLQSHSSSNDLNRILYVSNFVNDMSYIILVFYAGETRYRLIEYNNQTVFNSAEILTVIKQIATKEVSDILMNDYSFS